MEIIMRILSAAVTIFLVFFLVSYLYTLVEDVKKNLKNIARINYTLHNVIYFLVFCFFYFSGVLCNNKFDCIFLQLECKMV